MEIKFYADSDLADFVEGVREYEKLWAADGQRIIETWERLTGLKFTESFINAVVFDGLSCSHPLSLRYDYEPDQRRIVLVHELGHRILYRKIPNSKKLPRVAHHYFLDLVLADVLLELYGEAVLEKAIAFDRSLDGFRGNRYGEAWDWALSFTPEERQKVFNEILGGKIERFGLPMSQ